MLQRAQTRLHSAVARGDITLLQGDMQDLSALAAETFDLVTIPLNGLLHVDELEGQRRVLKQVARVLRPGGLLAADVLHAVPDALAAFDGRVMHEGTWEDEGKVVAKFSSRTVDWTNQLIGSEVWYDETNDRGAVSRHRTEFAMRWVNPAEFGLMLELSEFTDTNFAGSYDGSPLTDMSDRMLLVARKVEDS
jgi:SAM-dependent methyltransferase